MKNLTGMVRRCIEDYNMIENGDRIAVGVSGGKDSLALLCAMSELRLFLPKKYDIVALTLDMGFDKAPSIAAPKNDHAMIRALCDRLKVEYVVKESEIANVIFVFISMFA